MATGRREVSHRPRLVDEAFFSFWRASWHWVHAEDHCNFQPENNVWNYSEMYWASLRPSTAAVATLAEVQRSMIQQWGEVQRDIIRRCTAPFAASSAAPTSPTEPERSPTASPPEPEHTAGGEVDDNVEQADVDAATDEAPAMHNAALAILNNPALAAETATRRANEPGEYEVRDDVADDIAAEIQREVQQEFGRPSTGA